MSKTVILLTFLFSINLVHAQIPIGVMHDVNGMPLNGYFDPLVYSPDKKITEVHNSDSYEIGYYYDKLGNKIEGLIKFENSKILFKKEDEDFRKRIEPDEIRSLVIGVDSFFVANNFYLKNRIEKIPEFVQYITEFNDHTYALHYHFTSGMAQSYAMQSPIIETFLVKHKDRVIWDNFPDKKTFKERALKYFSHIPYLKSKILSGSYGSEDMLSIIKMAEYYEKYNNSTPIFYDKYWQEVRDLEAAKYSAKITNKIDSIWTFEYFMDSVKLYQANYSSFYPNLKNGDFIAYYPNGEIRQIVTYINNKAKEVKTFSSKGLLKTQYEIIKTKKEYISQSSSSQMASSRSTVIESGIDINYTVVNDSTGNNLLKEDSKTHQVINDSINGLLVHSLYESNNRVSFYRLLNKDTVFQITNPNYDFKIKSLQRNFNSFMSGKTYDNALSENAQGIILVSLLIDKKGYAVEGKVLNEIHPELDKLVNKFIRTKLLIRSEYRHRFRPYKKDKVKRYCELVIPFEFSINRFYRRPVNYNHFYYGNIHMMNQINYFKPPTIPSMPRGF